MSRTVTVPYGTVPYYDDYIRNAVLVFLLSPSLRGSIRVKFNENTCLKPHRSLPQRGAGLNLTTIKLLTRRPRLCLLLPKDFWGSAG